MVPFASLMGFDLRRVLALRCLPAFVADCRRYRKAAREGRFPLRVAELTPILTDYASEAGVARGHYFHQDLWAARRIFAARPRIHIDVGSRIDGFVAHLLTFMPVTVVDVRPLESTVTGLTFRRGSCLDLAWIHSGSVESLSSLHAAEHFGLGRYGDPIDDAAWATGMRELARVLQPQGRLYFSVPVGVERVQYNAHRIFSPTTVFQTFSDLDPVSFSAVGEDGRFYADPSPKDFESADYACGLFEFTKK